MSAATFFLASVSIDLRAASTSVYDATQRNYALPPNVYYDVKARLLSDCSCLCMRGPIRIPGWLVVTTLNWIRQGAEAIKDFYQEHVEELLLSIRDDLFETFRKRQQKMLKAFPEPTSGSPLPSDGTAQMMEIMMSSAMLELNQLVRATEINFAILPRGTTESKIGFRGRWTSSSRGRGQCQSQVAVADQAPEHLLQSPYFQDPGSSTSSFTPHYEVEVDVIHGLSLGRDRLIAKDPICGNTYLIQWHSLSCAGLISSIKAHDPLRIKLVLPHRIQGRTEHRHYLVCPELIHLWPWSTRSSAVVAEVLFPETLAFLAEREIPVTGVGLGGESCDRIGIPSYQIKLATAKVLGGGDLGLPEKNLDRISVDDVELHCALQIPV
ncbi:hypothetical protein SELMODRAFT_449344 [Selaginella moellendorffii]|uniref:Uncharacterized protein n=1 Tax=Selaginella moellendorffii TaxID=88036 RepID=D8TF96_SELML|nr:hypothetical protein SELMODRAFT_449344 [Selaginella moellendorffii]